MKGLLSFLYVSCLLFVSSCAAQELEPVLDVKVTHRDLQVVVASGGCTKVEDFDVAVSWRSEAGENKAEVSLVRREKDECKGFFPDGQTIQISRDSMGLSQDTAILLKNPLRAGRGISRPR